MFESLMSLAPSLISGIGSFFGGERRNKAQSEAAREMMAFQERMSSTAHQREVADLRAAGLNPILSAKLGGASSPAGAMPNIVDSIGEGARAGSATYAQTRLLDAQEDKLRAETAAALQNAKTSSALQALHIEQAYKTRQEGQREFLGLPYVAPQAEAVLSRTGQEVKNLEKSWHVMSQTERNLAIKNIADQLGLHGSARDAMLADIDKDYFNSPAGRALRIFQLGADAATSALPFYDRRNKE